MFFILLMFCSTLSIASAAAYISIYGLTSIFGGYSIISVWSFGSLEAGKLIAASFAYRYWHKINLSIKLYLILGIIGMMLITSAGIYGYFTSTYQKDTVPIDEMTQRVVLLQQEKSELLKRKAEIDTDVASKRTAITKKEMVEKGGAYYDELQYITPRIRELTQELQKIKIKKLQTKQHVGPIVYIAKIFDLPVDNAISYMVVLIMFVFDPMAIILTICLNIAIMDRTPVQRELSEELINADMSLDAELEQAHAGMSVDELEEILHKYDADRKNRQPSKSEQIQKEAIAQMLNRKRVTEEVRNPTKIV